jgi:hypothetical protein
MMTLDLLIRVCDCLVKWHSCLESSELQSFDPSGGYGSSGAEPLHLSLHNFLVTFIPQGTLGMNHDDSGHAGGHGSGSGSSSVRILNCELCPIITHYKHVSDSLDNAHTMEFLLPPELFHPLKSSFQQSSCINLETNSDRMPNLDMHNNGSAATTGISTVSSHSSVATNLGMSMDIDTNEAAIGDASAEFYPMSSTCHVSPVSTEVAGMHAYCASSVLFLLAHIWCY